MGSGRDSGVRERIGSSVVAGVGVYGATNSSTVMSDETTGGGEFCEWYTGDTYRGDSPRNEGGGESGDSFSSATSWFMGDGVVCVSSADVVESKSRDIGG